MTKSLPTQLVRVAIPAPLYSLFDYSVSIDLLDSDIENDVNSGVMPGSRVSVSFGRQRLVGVIWQLPQSSDVPAKKLKAVSQVLDSKPLLPESLMTLIQWSADYYLYPLGEVVHQALPVALRKTESAPNPQQKFWAATDSGRTIELTELSRARKQQQLLTFLRAQTEPVSHTSLKEQFEGSWQAALKGLQDKGLAVAELKSAQTASLVEGRSIPHQICLNPEQQQAVDSLVELKGFAPVLVEGVTGSGKTEVYLRYIESCLNQPKANQQVLVLVPEIGLTPQLLNRFASRFDCPIALLHSGLNDTERLLAWQAASSGNAQIVIGTRSAIYTPMPNLAAIIIDEEHDRSLKQQEGFRYSARDVAIKRAHLEQIPVILGSATPSLETLHNAQQGRYQHIRLMQRAGGAKPPSITLLDVRNKRIEHGISHPLLRSINEVLERGEQVLLFQNRRGFSPVLQCHECGWVAKCQRCDAHMTVHQKQRRLRCHHCGSEQAMPHHCEPCGSEQLQFYGAGTERIEQVISQLFPAVEVIRIDRDTTRRKGSLEATLERVKDGQKQILIGTQMLAKGHHFPNVTLVVLLDVDQGLFSTDYRASEVMAQLIEQVAGRAGRAEKPGQVVLQTHHPDNALLTQLVGAGYGAFAQAALYERQMTNLPPYSYQALFRAESVVETQAQEFLQQVLELGEKHMGELSVSLLGPVPSPMERRAGRYRAQLLCQANERSQLHRLLRLVVPQINNLPLAKRVRWNLDVDPVEMY